MRYLFSMGKVIRLTESELVNIIKRVVSEQTKDGPVIPKNTTIEIDNSVIDDFKKMGISLKTSEKPVSFLEKLNKSNIGINAFHIESEGYKFPIEPVFVKIPFKGGSIRLSCEPFNKTYGLNMCKVTKEF